MTELRVLAPDGVARGTPRRRPGGAARSRVVELADGDVVRRDQQGRQQGRGPGRGRHPRGRAARRDRPGRRPARPDHDRAHPPRADPGRGRDRRLQRRSPAASCCCPRIPDASARAIRARGCASGPAQRRRHRHRHRRPGLARGPDRHRRSAPPGCASLEDYAGRRDAHGNELAVTAPGRGRRARRGRRAGAGQARRPAVRRGARPRRPGAAARRATGRAPRRWCGPRAPTCSATAPARPCCRALRGDAGDRRPFGRPAPAAELAAVADRRLGRCRRRPPTATARAASPRTATCRRRASRSLRPRLGTVRRADEPPPNSGAPRRSLRRLCPRPPTRTTTIEEPTVAKPAKTDRQAGHRRDPQKQKSAEKRRGLMIVGVCVAIALLIVGRRGVRAAQRSGGTCAQFNSIDLADDRRAGLGLPGRHHQEGQRQLEHVPTDTSRSPTRTRRRPFGPHWNEPGVAPAPIERKFYTEDDRPELEALVHNLEHGYTILWYDDTIADDDDGRCRAPGHRRQVRRHRQPAHKFIAARGPPRTRTARRSPTASTSRFTHWSVGERRRDRAGEQVGVWQYCSDVSAARRWRLHARLPLHSTRPSPRRG